MTYHATFPLHEQREPTLKDRLRFIDMKFECAKEAKELYPSPSGPCFADEAPEPNPLFGPAYRFLLAQKVRREGLPASLLEPTLTAAERHQERMSELAGGEWDRSKLNLTPVRAGDVA